MVSTKVTVANIATMIRITANGLNGGLDSQGQLPPISIAADPGGGGPSGSSRRNTITNEPETAARV